MNTEHKIPAPKVQYKNKASLKKKNTQWMKGVILATTAAAVVAGFVVGMMYYGYEQGQVDQPGTNEVIKVAEKTSADSTSKVEKDELITDKSSSYTEQVVVADNGNQTTEKQSGRNEDSTTKNTSEDDMSDLENRIEESIDEQIREVVIRQYIIPAVSSETRLAQVNLPEKSAEIEFEINIVEPIDNSNENGLVKDIILGAPELKQKAERMLAGIRANIREKRGWTPSVTASM